MKRLAIIPVKTFSRRLKKKNFLKVGKKPLYRHTLNNIIKTNKFDEIHISSEKIVNKKYQSFLRPKSLTKNKTTLDEVIFWTINKYISQGIKFDVICLAYATSPLIESKDYSLALKKFEKTNRKNPLISASKFHTSFDEALVFSKKYLVPFNKKKFFVDSRRHRNFYFETGSFIFLSSKTYEKKNIKKFKQKKFIPYFLPFEKSVDINNKDDLKIIKKLYKLKK